ncbi:MAG TPA: glutathione S-transferase family protein [Gammaproteobacteria bacterium]
MKPLLLIGNKNYSSWSLRAWLLLRHAGIEFDERRISLSTPAGDAALAAETPAGLVPVLRDGEVTVWESLAIAEYVAERVPGLWPEEPGERALARSLSAEMHAGFAALRHALPMNCRARGRQVTLDAAAARDVARVQRLWTACRERSRGKGPWLFGRFGVVDAMYAPVASRFATYAITGNGPVTEYVAGVLGDPHVREWYAAAAAEPEVIEEEEVGVA